MILRTITFASLWSVCLLAANAVTLEEVALQPNSWPAEVVTTAATRAVVVDQGQAAGTMLFGVGRKLTVVGVTVEGIIAKTGSTTVRLPVEKTDFWRRMESAGVEPPPVATVVDRPTASSERSVSVAPGVATAPSVMQRRLAGKLVRLQGSALQPANETSLAGVKYFALYYSASWCGPCRQFTPGFLAEYKKLKARHPEFEVVFISRDRNAGAMRDYMRDDGMVWPALKYGQSDRELMRYMGPGIPCLVLVDEKGVVISDSFEGDNYVGPQKVLGDLNKLLKRRG